MNSSIAQSVGLVEQLGMLLEIIASEAKGCRSSTQICDEAHIFVLLCLHIGIHLKTGYQDFKQILSAEARASNTSGVTFPYLTRIQQRLAGAGIRYQGKGTRTRACRRFFASLNK